MTNQSHPPRPAVRLFRRFSLVLLGTAIAALPSQGDVIILKDGYAIHGKVLNEKSEFFDNLTGEQIITRKLNALTMVDDGPRYTVFSPHYRRVGEVSTYDKFQEFVQTTRRIYRQTAFPLPTAMRFDKGTEWNDKWQRTLFYFNTAGVGRYEIKQQIDVLTPHYMRINSYSHQWQSYYLTREYSSSTIRKLLSTHPEYQEKGGKADVGKRAKLVRFLIQADWLDEADEEIERLLKDLPEETKKADELRDTIREVRLEESVAEIERAKAGGRHNFAMTALKQAPKDKVPAKLALKIAGFKAEYEAATARIDKARRYLKELQMEVKKPSFLDLIDASEFISSELHLDTAPRLELFIALAEQAERSRKAGKTPLQKPEELLAAAVSGWLMGNNSTETSVVTARKRLKTRNIALKFLREPSEIKRREILLDYEKDSGSLPFDELEKLISLLPPPEARKIDSANPKTNSMPLSTGPTDFHSDGVNYVLQLPPEYQHGRSYPLLIVAPHGGERAADALKRFGDLPARNGYIVAVVDWNNNGIQNTYDFSEEEQATVTEMLRHLRRTLQVDSDRVFMFGYGEGANMAMDLGSSHPDLFAGIVPMTPTPDWKTFRVFEYWKNFQNLPVYMVVGDHAGASVDTIRGILTSWMPRGYPAVAVSYKGRGFEWFNQELPYIFDWMGRKTRSTATPELGRDGEEYRTVRLSSNRFYWISSGEIEPANLYDPQRRSRIFLPAKFYARISEGNHITIEEFGFRQMSIWLGKGSVDFAKPIVLTIRGRGSWKKELTPRISVLLEDLYKRGDRQRPYYQRIDCDKLNGVAKFAAQ